MFDPVSFSYPPGWTNPVILRVSGALAAAGAWDATPLESSAMGAGGISFSFTYTRGAAGGAFDWQIEVSLYGVAANVPAGSVEWIPESLYAAGVLAAGVDTQSRVQREYQTYQSQAAAVESFVFVLGLSTPIERIRVTCRESGVILTPGVVQVSAILY